MYITRIYGYTIIILYYTVLTGDNAIQLMYKKVRVKIIENVGRYVFFFFFYR